MTQFFSNFYHTGAKRNMQEKDGLTPLHLAVYHGHVNCVKLLIEHGADVNSTSRYMCMLWFNFNLGLNFIFLCFWVW